jgi:MFS family permease
VGLVVALAVVWASEGDARYLSRPAFQTLVALGIVPAALAVAVLALGARETRHPVAGRSSDQPGFGRLDPRFKRFLLIAVVFTLGNSSDAFLVLRAREAGLPVPGVLAMMITFNVVYTLASGPAGAISDRLGRRRVIVAGWVVYALIYLGFARVTTGGQAWALMSVYGLYYAATEGVARAYVADLVPPGLRGTAYGVYNAAVALAALPASLVAGVLWQGVGGWSGFGPSAPFYFGATMALAAAIGLLTLVPTPKPDSLEETELAA